MSRVSATPFRRSIFSPAATPALSWRAGSLALGLETDAVVGCTGILDHLPQHFGGHVATLQAAAQCGDSLFVAVNSDRGVRLLKGPGRPVVSEQQRSAMLAALECVDYVIVFHAATPEELLRRLRPDVLVKGGDRGLEHVVGRRLVEGYGGQVMVTGHVAGVSTTELCLRVLATGSCALT